MIFLINYSLRIRRDLFPKLVKAETTAQSYGFQMHLKDLMLNEAPG